jgi:hypothetical protein
MSRAGGFRNRYATDAPEQMLTRNDNTAAFRANHHKNSDLTPRTARRRQPAVSAHRQTDISENT